MTETELERLVVRLTGDGSSYQKMITEAEQGNRKLDESLKRLEASQKKMDEANKQTTKSWTDFVPIIAAVRWQMEQYGNTLSMVGTAIDRTKAKIEESKEAIRTFGHEVASVSKAAAMGTGAFDTPSSFSRWQTASSGETWSRAMRATSAGIQRNLPTVMSDESTLDLESGRLDVYKRRITAREAEHEAYHREKNARGASSRLAEAAMDRARERTEVDRIRDPEERAAALRARVNDALREEQRLRNSVESTTGGGARADYERADSRYVAKGYSAFMSAIYGVEDPYQKELAKKKQRLDEEREALERQENIRRREQEREKDFEISRKHLREDTLRDFAEDSRTASMSPEQKRADRWRKAGITAAEIPGMEAGHKAAEKSRETAEITEHIRRENEALKEQAELYGKVGIEAKIAALEKKGVAPEVVAEHRGHLETQARQEREEGLESILESTNEIGLSARQVRDRRRIRKMREEGASDTEIQNYQNIQGEHDKKTDEKERADNLKEVVRQLNAQAAAYRNNKDAMQPYYTMMEKMDDAQKKQLRTAVEAREEEKKRAVGRSQGEQLNLKHDPRLRFDKRKKELDEMLQRGDITKKTYDKELQELNRSLTRGGPRQQFSFGSTATAVGSVESLAELARFREDAFGDSESMSNADKSRLEEARRWLRDLEEPESVGNDVQRQQREQAAKEDTNLLTRIANAVERNSETKVEISGIR